MFDFAVNSYKYPGNKTLDIFLSSGIAAEFEKGNPKYIAGRSGPELFFEISNVNVNQIHDDKFYFSLSKSAEFWCGWILAYYQWFYNTTFANIRSKLAFDDLLNLYPALHEADKQKAAEILRKRISPNCTPTKLQTARKAAGLSQADLALLSGVSLRSIQMYEQKNKDINKAQADTLHAFSKILHLSIEELLED
ncbi:MAG: helix-turn-helix domain-containing protein [Treponema sp.]|nr:helix-turn-helix domain-containing protein [Treponema sp.]